jgi:hypothetical protein
MKPGEVCDVEPTGLGAVVLTDDGQWYVWDGGVWHNPEDPGNDCSWDEVVGDDVSARLVCTGVMIPQGPMPKVEAEKMEDLVGSIRKVADSFKSSGLRWSDITATTNITTSTGSSFVYPQYVPAWQPNIDEGLVREVLADEPF